MALKLTVVGEDTVTTSYHRVVKIETVVNRYTRIQVESVIDASARAVQKAYDGSESYVPPYSTVMYYTADYGAFNDATGAYEYLKSLPEFEGATDIFEEGQK